MIRCEECLRANPPTRIACFYCSAALPLEPGSLELRKLSLRPPGKNELGFNVIIAPTEYVSNELPLNDVASLLKLSAETVQSILHARKALPLTRTASLEEAGLLVERLAALGVESRLLSDDELGSVTTGVIRVRVIGFDDECPSFHHSGGTEKTMFEWTSVKLIITGRLVTRTVEVRERKLRKEENEILSTSEFFTDEPVIDLYLNSDVRTWRIPGNGFDFSCLGSKKGLLAHENLRTLLSLLTEKAPTAIRVGDYDDNRKILDQVWTMDQQTQSRGWKRDSPGKYSISGETIESNESQFTRYSKLQSYFSETH
jgi:hypothetical protein